MLKRILLIVILLTGSCNLFADSKLTMDLVKRVPMEAPLSNQAVMFNNGILLALNNGNVIALKRDFKRKWEVWLDEKITATPLIYDDILFVGSTKGVFRAFNIDNGKLWWDFSAEDKIQEKAAVDEENVYFGSDDNYLYSLKQSNGELNWRFLTSDKVLSVPKVYKDYVIFGSLDKNLYCLNKDEGALAWKFKTNAAVLAEPLVIDDVIYFGSYDSYFYALNLDGYKIWHYAAGNSIHLKALRGNDWLVFADRNKTLHCLTKEGLPVWETKLPEQVTSPLMLMNNLIVAALMNGNIVFVDVKTGELVYTSEIREARTPFINSWGNQLLVTDEKGNFRFYEVKLP